jgi:hypothetical protein
MRARVYDQPAREANVASSERRRAASSALAPVHGVLRYQAFSFAARALPSGSLRVSLLSESASATTSPP